VTPGQLLTAEQLADRWQVRTSHVYRLAREGRIPCVRLGRYQRFRLDAIEAWESQQSTTQRLRHLTPSPTHNPKD
jgi:excisionase family DNA binding protein